MKRTTLIIFCLFCLVNAPALANAPWYKQLLSSYQKYHSDFILKSNETKTITFDTEEKMLVGFWINPNKLTTQQTKKYISNFPISIEHKEEKRSIKSFFGSSGLFKPVKGKINLLVQNHSEDDFEIVIYTHPLDYSDY